MTSSTVVAGASSDSTARPAISPSPGFISAMRRARASGCERRKSSSRLDTMAAAAVSAVDRRGMSSAPYTADATASGAATDGARSTAEPNATSSKYTRTSPVAARPVNGRFAGCTRANSSASTADRRTFAPPTASSSWHQESATPKCVAIQATLRGWIGSTTTASSGPAAVPTSSDTVSSRSSAPRWLSSAASSARL